MKSSNLISNWPVLLAVALAPSLHAQTSAFTYQGQLIESGALASGIYDFEFTLYGSSGGMDVVGESLTNNAVLVSNGLFTVTLDYGSGVFDGNERWLDISVRTNGTGIFDALSPRQAITSAPYAIRAGTAQEADQALNAAPDSVSDASVVDGSLLAEDLAPGQVVKSLNTLRDEVELLEGPNVSIATAPGSPGIITVSGSEDWKLSGNAGSTAGVDFVGTTDNQPLELKINSQRALRLEPTAGAPNVIGGSETNAVTAGAEGATIGGGSDNRAGAKGDLVGGGYGNQALGGYSVVVGGEGNSASGYHALVGGGQLNLATNSNATIAGGEWNTASGFYAIIGGGRDNNIGELVANATISGGAFNTVETNGDCSSIGGGLYNTIASNSFYSVVGGGSDKQHLGI